MARNNRFYYNTRYILPVMIGMIVGFAFSLLCTPFYDCDNSFGLFDSNFSKYSLNRFKKFAADEQANLFQQQNDDFEPRINLQGKPKKPSKTGKIVRPRYASVELKIRYKLFIGVISTTRMLSNFSIFLNQTLSTVSKKVTFFVNNAEMNEKILLETTPPGVNVVNFNDDRDHLLPFHSLKYVIDNYAEQFDWFFFVTDTTFVRAYKLLDLVNHLSMSQDLYMGYVENKKESIYCSLSSGIIFSYNVLIKVSSQMEWCTKNSYSENSSDNIGRCVLHSANLACTNTANGRNTTYFSSVNFDFDYSIDQLIFSEKFNQSLTVYRVKDIETMKKLKLYFDVVEMDEIDKEIEFIEQDMMITACDTPEGCDSLIWPLGVPPPYKPTSRHEVIRFDYFNLTHLYFGTDFDVVTIMPESYKTDVEELLTYSLENLNKEIPFRYQFRDLLNGYKQFDPTRGSFYIFDLLLYDTLQEIQIHKRVNVMRQLGLLEIMPMPYVTENQKINLIITFTAENNYQDILRFFESYQDFVLEIKEIAEKINLIVVYLTTDNQMPYEKELFAYIGFQIKELTQKYSSLIETTSRIIELNVTVTKINLYFSESYRQMLVIDHVSKSVSGDGLILMALPCVEFKSEFLNRVRLNTIKNHQVFLPIPFSEFMPSVIYPSNMTYFPSEVEINKNIGYFNMHTYDFVSFYNSDYLESRMNYISSNKIVEKFVDDVTLESIKLYDYSIDLYDLFKSNPKINIIRATDQALKCRWYLMNNCDKPKSSNEEKERCFKQKENSLGTKSQLALHLMKNYGQLTRN
ncbi:unnamed protein product [Brachionus calyciflorus]|uniref:Hexosyltransferase n=1 Tax=Brachionus calyciflorus TaxID=104777 RepID=A0A813ZD94_9BILA|nr:unnamed protein product [Brachionus calyciflorus]